LHRKQPYIFSYLKGRCPTEIRKNFLIEDFFHLPPVKKTRSKRSRDTVPINRRTCKAGYQTQDPGRKAKTKKKTILSYCLDRREEKLLYSFLNYEKNKEKRMFLFLNYGTNREK
jgi:hypothetical protein